MKNEKTKSNVDYTLFLLWHDDGIWVDMTTMKGSSFRGWTAGQ